MTFAITVRLSRCGAYMSTISQPSPLKMLKTGFLRVMVGVAFVVLAVSSAPLDTSDGEVESA